MRRARPGRTSGPKALSLSLRLYVVGGAPNSAAALENLRALLKSVGDDSFALEVIDVLREPGRALADGVIVSPTLVRVGSLPSVRILGNLNDREAVRRALGITVSSP